MDGVIRTSEKVLKPQERASLALRGLYRALGYKPYKMSKFEEYDLYVRNKDFLVSDRVITFTGEGGKLLALKPDVTLSIIKNTPESPSGVNKVYYNETVYRAESVSGHGDYAEIMQTGLECFGKLDSYSVCEVVLLALDSLKAINEKHILELSHMGILSELLDCAGLSGEKRVKMLSCIGEKNRAGVASVCAESDLSADMTDKFTSLVSAYGKITEVVDKLDTFCVSERAREALEELKVLAETLDTCGASENVWIDFSVVNDMRYYSGIVFRGFIDSVPTGVLSGGRYDNLLKKMGREGGAIGFAVYLDHLERLDKTCKKYDADVFLIYGEGNTPAEIYENAKKLTANGESLLSGKEIPDGVVCERVVDIRKLGE